MPLPLAAVLADLSAFLPALAALGLLALLHFSASAALASRNDIGPSIGRRHHQEDGQEHDRVEEDEDDDQADHQARADPHGAADSLALASCRQRQRRDDGH